MTSVGSGGPGGLSSIPAATAAAVEHHGELLALVDGPTQYTYSELAEAARTFAAALVAAAGRGHAGTRSPTPMSRARLPPMILRTTLSGTPSSCFT